MKKRKLKRVYQCLNPYYTGSRSTRGGVRCRSQLITKVEQRLVLILILPGSRSTGGGVRCVSKAKS